jgi:hypothetical protein
MICSEDPQALSAFYTKVLGEPAWQDSGYVGWQAGSATLMIGPHSEVKGRNEMPGRIIVNFETSDVQGEFDRIKGLGARLERVLDRACLRHALWSQTDHAEAPRCEFGGEISGECLLGRLRRSVATHQWGARP